MPVDFFSLDITAYQLISLSLYAVLVGFERAGLRSAVLPSVPLVVESFGAVEALGYMIPLLVIADIFSVSYYRKHTDKKELIKLIPFAAVGITAGLMTGGSISQGVLKKVIGTLIIISLIIISLNKRLSSCRQVTGCYKNTGPFFSMAAGFTSMLGGAGGPLISTYFLLTNVTKEVFIGTTAWFFFFVNMIKFPLYLLVWKNIHINTLAADLFMLPVVAAGIFFGLMIVKRIPEKGFRIFIFSATLLSALKLFF